MCRVDPARNCTPASAITRPNTGGQTVFGIIGQRDCLVDIFDSHDRRDGAERFLAHQRHRVIDIDDDSRPEIIATRKICRPLPTADDFRAHLTNLIEFLFDSLALAR